MNFTEFVEKFRRARFTSEEKTVLIDILLEQADADVFEHYFEKETVITHPESYGKETRLGNEDWRNWANGRKTIMNGTDEQKLASWHVYTIGGFSPDFYKKNAWLNFMDELLRAAGGDPKMVEKGIRAGQAARIEGNLTFGNPMAYLSFIRDLVSRKELEQHGFKFGEEIWA